MFMLHLLITIIPSAVVAQQNKLNQSKCESFKSKTPIWGVLIFHGKVIAL